MVLVGQCFLFLFPVSINFLYHLHVLEVRRDRSVRRVAVLARGLRNRSGDEPAEGEVMGGTGMDGPQTDGNNGVSGRFALKKPGNHLIKSFFFPSGVEKYFSDVHHVWL